MIPAHSMPRPAPLSVALQPAFSWFALLVVAQLAVALPLQLLSPAFGLFFAELFLFAAPVLLWLRATGFDPVRFSGAAAPRPLSVAAGAALGAANFLFAGSLQALCRRLLPGLAEQNEVARLFREASGAELGLLVGTVVVAAPLCEELLFRGYLQTVLSARYRTATAVGATALLFALLHLDPVGLVSRVELGVLFGLLAWRSASLWPAVAAHATNNGLAAAGLLVLAARENPGPEQTPVGEALLTGGLSLAATLALVALIQRLGALRPTSPPASTDLPAPTAGEAFADWAEHHRFHWDAIRLRTGLWLLAAAACLGSFFALRAFAGR